MATTLADLVAHLETSFRPFAERKGLRLVTRTHDLVVATDLVLDDGAAHELLDLVHTRMAPRRSYI